jgi:hypothetical protein
MDILEHHRVISSPVAVIIPRTIRLVALLWQFSVA